MKDVNKMILVGRLGADPVQRQTKSGNPVVQLSVATSRRIPKEGSDSSTETSFVDETQWHRVSVWGRQAEVCAQYLKKGNTVYVEGLLKTKEYLDKNGQNKMSVEIQAENISFLGGKPTSTEKKEPQTDALAASAVH